MQTARTKLHTFKDLAIRPECPVIIDPAGHIRPVARHHLAMCNLLEVENVQGACCIRYESGGRSCSCLCRNSRQANESADSAGGGDVWACSEEFQKLTA